MSPMSPREFLERIEQGNHQQTAKFNRNEDI
jgi:hypothetical protein